MIRKLGRVGIFVSQGLIGIFFYFFNRNKLTKQNLINEMYSFGVKSIPLVFIVSLFTGMVLIVQLVPEFKIFGAESLTGGAISVAIARELGPTLTAIIIAGRVGSSITAELGSMKVTEQISALEVMAVNPVIYLVSPKIIAGLIMLPMLTILADFLGIFGGYFIGIYSMGLASGAYVSHLEKLLSLNDVLGGLFKSIFFAMIIVFVASYKGMKVLGGAQEVGEATTDAVVISIMLILVFNFFLSILIFV
ncbi:MAG: MlaE family ABC transporter permease [Fusobacteriota bacterium]